MIEDFQLNTFLPTTVLMPDLGDKQKASELLEKFVGGEQLVKIQAEDWQATLRKGQHLAIVEGTGETGSVAIDKAMKHVKSMGLDLNKAEGLLACISISSVSFDELYESLTAFSRFLDENLTIFLKTKTFMWTASKNSSHYLYNFRMLIVTK